RTAEATPARVVHPTNRQQRRRPDHEGATEPGQEQLLRASEESGKARARRGTRSRLRAQRAEVAAGEPDDPPDQRYERGEERGKRGRAARVGIARVRLGFGRVLVRRTAGASSAVLCR